MKYRTRFALFFVAMVMFSLSSNFAHPITPTIIQDLHLNDYMFGVALAMMQLSNFIVSPFWGKINRYISSRTTLLIGCTGYGLAQMWFALATTESMIICARLLAGAFVGGIQVSFLTYVVNAATEKDQPRFLTWSATITSVGGAFGYLLGGLMGEWSIRGTFLVQAATLVATGIVFYIFSISDKQEHKPLSIAQVAKETNPLKAFVDCGKFMTAAFAALFAVNILINFGNTGFDQAFNYYLKDQLNLTSSYNGVIKAAVGFVSFISNMTLCVWIINKTNVKRSMAVLCGVCTLSALGALFVPGITGFIACAVLVYAAYSVSLPVLQNMVAAQADPAQKNLVMGFYNATKSLGSIAGSLIAGFIYSVNVKLPFACTALIYGLALVAALVYLRQMKTK